MFALALVNVDAGLPAPPPTPQPPRRYTTRSTPTANHTRPTDPTASTLTNTRTKAAARQRGQWSTSMQRWNAHPSHRDHPETAKVPHDNVLQWSTSMQGREF